jgi:hypothetical protein
MGRLLTLKANFSFDKKNAAAYLSSVKDRATTELYSLLNVKEHNVF